MRNQITIIVLLVLFGLVPSARAENLWTFDGQINLKEKTGNVTVHFGKERSVYAEASETADGAYHVQMDIQRIKTPLFDLSSEVETNLRLAKDAQTQTPYLTGDIATQYALVDYKPVDDFKGTFALKGQKLYVQSFASRQLSASGEVALAKAPQINMTFNLRNINLNDFLNFWRRTKTYDSDGLVSGKIHASGGLKNLVLQGSLEAHSGFIKTLQFDSIYLDADGIYPYLNVSRAQISKTDGLSFALSGPLDLSKHKMFKQQIKDMVITPLVKGGPEQSEWTIRSTKESEGSAAYELKYLLRKDDFEQAHEDKDAGILGIQRSMEW